MAAKVAYIDRVLKAYGPEADEVRRQFREMVEEDTRRLWPRVDLPFEGMIRISSEPMLRAISHVAK
jgi:hypothetical protein